MWAERPCRFAMPGQEADAEVEALRALIPADERRQLVEQVVWDFANLRSEPVPGNGWYTTSDDPPYLHRTRVCAGCTGVDEDDLADGNLATSVLS